VTNFPNTTWGMVSSVKEPVTSADRREGMEKLCRRYWEPIFSYTRAAWARTEEDARDLTQDFFTWLLETDVLERFEPARGSFRFYMKGLLRNFSRNAAQAARALKRGGGQVILPLDEALAPALADGRREEAEAAFDRAWVAEIMRRAVERAREKLATGKRAKQWRVFEDYDLAAETAEHPTYAALAERHGLKESDVRNALYAIREKVRDEVRAELRDTVSDPRDLEDEWRRVVGA
jgi:RNA polymerase sigma-70 factor (ECF subfamily)